MTRAPIAAVAPLPESAEVSLSSPSSERPLESAAAAAICVYVVWVIFVMIAWIQHLGSEAVGLRADERTAPWVAHIVNLVVWCMPAGSSNVAAASLGEFLWHNAPLGALFVIQHSSFSIRRLTLTFCVPPRYARLLYNFASALVLHAFLVAHRPLAQPVLLVLPVPRLWRFLLGFATLACALLAFLSEPRTAAMLGLSPFLPTHWRARLPEGRVDIITWINQCLHAIGSDPSFVLFSGISIVPREVTAGDCVIRGVAAVYLRYFSPSFRRWVQQLETAHVVSWVIRMLFLVAACAAIGDEETHTPAGERSWFVASTGAIEWSRFAFLFAAYIAFAITLRSFEGHSTSYSAHTVGAVIKH